jgi:hypothetical protein
MHYAKTKRRRKLPVIDSASPQGGKGEASNDAVQGEGNYEAAREFNAAQRRFVQSGKVDAAARGAAPKSDAEKQQMAEAEQGAKSRAKEDYPPPPERQPGGTAGGDARGSATDAARSEPSKDAERRRK